MNIIIAMDSFKGSINSIEAGNAVSEGIKRVYKDADVTINPLADGGEGTVKTLIYGMDGVMENITVTGPLGRKVDCNYGILKNEKTAVIEMAATSGITLLEEDERNPLYTTTYGVGEIIIDAINKGCRKFIIGIGGSATNDGGIGMLQALGYSITDERGNDVSYGAEGLKELVKIDDTNIFPELKECIFTIACDVKNPLCGKNGCSEVYGPQKGATKDMVKDMDLWMKKYALAAKKYNDKADENIEGSGAAGGMGFAFLTFLNSRLVPGIDIVIKETNLEEKIKKADIVITGEGCMDGQTAMGKAPVGVAKIAKKYEKKVIGFSGITGIDAEKCNLAGIDAFFPIIKKLTTLDEALDKKNASANLTDTAEQVFRLIKLFS